MFSSQVLLIIKWITIFHSLHLQALPFTLWLHSYDSLTASFGCRWRAGPLRLKIGSSVPTRATVNIAMPWREAHGGVYKLADFVELPDKVLSAPAQLIKACPRGFKVICLFGSNKMPPCWLKSLVISSFNSKAGDNASWKEEAWRDGKKKAPFSEPQIWPTLFHISAGDLHIFMVSVF